MDWSTIEASLVSSRARKLLFLCSLLTVALFPVFWGWMHPSTVFLSMRIFWTVFAMLATAGLLLLWLAMWTYWFRLDHSKRFPKAVWFLLLLVGFWYGSLAYYFFAYLPQTSRKT